ncbi:MAG: acyltransferase family protein [Povalibacter sp.]
MLSAVAKTLPTLVSDEKVQTSEHYRAEVDGLRGIAVLAVIGFHAFPEYFPGGFVGVDVFFVISGFLISSIILRQLSRSSFSFSDFYARRIRRIFPSLLVVLTASLLFGGFVLFPQELEQLGKHVGSASIFVSNFTLWEESGYFDSSAEFKPLLHLWSLGIEEQFYLLWPMALLVLWRWPQRIRISVAVLTIASFALCLAIGSRSAVANFYFPLSRFWELGLGCLLAVMKVDAQGGRSSGAHRATELARIAQSVAPIVGIALIALAVFLFDRRTQFPGWAALLPTVGAMCVVASSGRSWFQRRIMGSTALVSIGVISYPLYLWHWPLLSFSWILGAGEPDSSVRVLAVVASVGLAWATYVLFERPIRAQRSRRVTFALVASLATLGAAGFVMYAARGFPERFEVDVREMIPEAKRDALCPIEFDEREVFNYCKSTQPRPPAAIFLGDSRAQGIYDGVVSAVGARYPLTLLARGGCPAVLGVDLHYVGERDCLRAWEIFVEYVQKVKPQLVIVVGGGAGLLDPTDAEYTETDQFASRKDALRFGLHQLISALQRTSRVIYIREVPRFESSPNCFLRPITLPTTHCIPVMPRSIVDQGTASYNEVVDQIQAELPGLRVLDPAVAVCDSLICSQKLSTGEILYADQLHLNTSGGRHFAYVSGLLSLMEDALGSDH